MKKKSKGLTLIELIIALALTVIILGIVYTFYLSSNRNLTLVDLQADLHTDGKAIEDKILKVGTEAKEVVSIKNTSDNELIGNTINGLGLDAIDETIAVNSLTFKSYNEAETNIIFDVINHELLTSGGNVLSKNVDSIKIKPLNLNQMSDIDKDTKLVKDLSGFEITIILRTSKGRIETTHPVVVNVKFRNKEDLDSKVRKEAKNIQVNIANKGALADGISSIMTSDGKELINTPLKTLLDSDGAADINSIEFINPDNTKVSFVCQGKILTMQIGEKDNSDETILSEGIKEFKIRIINSSDIENDEMTLKDLLGFEIVGEVELGSGSNLVYFPIDVIVKFK